MRDLINNRVYFFSINTDKSKTYYKLIFSA